MYLVLFLLFWSSSRFSRSLDIALHWGQGSVSLATRTRLVYVSPDVECKYCPRGKGHVSFALFAHLATSRIRDDETNICLARVSDLGYRRSRSKWCIGWRNRAPGILWRWSNDSIGAYRQLCIQLAPWCCPLFSRAILWYGHFLAQEQ